MQRVCAGESVPEWVKQAKHQQAHNGQAAPSPAPMRRIFVREVRPSSLAGTPAP